MRYRLRAKLEGQLFLTEAFSIERDGLLFEFIAGDNGQVQELAISLKVPDEKVEKFASGIGPGQGESVATYTIGGDRELYNHLVSELQSLESNLAFASGSVKRIHWDTPHQQFIAETPEEEELITFTEFSLSRTYPEPHALFSPVNLIRLISKFPAYESLRVPMAFWREGENYFTTFQYVLAFYQYYFIIEDFYAGGKTGQSTVLTGISHFGRPQASRAAETRWRHRKLVFRCRSIPGISNSKGQSKHSYSRSQCIMTRLIMKTGPARAREGSTSLSMTAADIEAFSERGPPSEGVAAVRLKYGRRAPRSDRSSRRWRRRPLLRSS